MVVKVMDELESEYLYTARVLADPYNGLYLKMLVNEKNVLNAIHGKSKDEELSGYVPEIMAFGPGLWFREYVFLMRRLT